jgi:hypothetical protein
MERIPMDWTAAVDGYCERIGPEFWAEPLNAVTNLGFVLVAVRSIGRMRGLPRGQAMCAVLGLIGVGSFLFHTVAQRWAGLADVLPIGLFILLYLYAACRDYLRLTTAKAGLATLAFFIGILGLSTALGAALPGLQANAAYLAVDLAILGFGVALLRRNPMTGRGMILGAAMLTLSIGFRMLDAPLCSDWPHGTHFIWHLLNAVMLGWMIAVYRRHMLAGRAPQG